VSRLPRNVIDVTVVIATYRRPAELVEAARSVLDQRGPSLEILVVDDCASGSATIASPTSK
jgi:glycosyltransferase involved in cell wall biosynthesis